MVSQDCHNVNNNKKVSPYLTVSRKLLFYSNAGSCSILLFEMNTRQDDTRVVSKSKIDTSDATAAYDIIVLYLHLKKVMG